MVKTICGICQDDVCERTFVEGCNHEFCFACIVQWANTSNTCPLCQKRFYHLMRDKKVAVKVKQVDNRGENALRVMEEFDSESASLAPEDDDEEEMGSEGDYLEEDFVVPDGVIIKDDGSVWDMRQSMEYHNPFGKVKYGQRNCVFTTEEGREITISWLSDQVEQPRHSRSGPAHEWDEMDEDEEFMPRRISETSETIDSDDANDDDANDANDADDVNDADDTNDAKDADDEDYYSSS